MSLFSLAGVREPEIFVERAGHATMARLAAAAVADGRSAVLVAESREAFGELESLAILSTPDLSSGDRDPGAPSWTGSVVSFPPGLLLRRDRSAWVPRMAALHALSLGGPRLVVASAESLLLRYPPTDFFLHRSLDLARGQDVLQELLVEQLARWGYVRVPMVTRPGEFCRRGDILDVFAPGYASPLRLEFFGDTIDEIRLFDAQSQRSRADRQEATIVPAMPCIMDEAGQAAALARVAALLAAGELDENTAYDCRKALEQDTGFLMPGLVHERSSLLEEWLGKDPLYFCGGESDTRDLLAAVHADLSAVLEDPDTLPVQPAALCLRPTAHLPWATGASVVHNEPLVMGVENRGTALPERPIPSFSSLFPDPGAQDRPWLQVSSAIREWAGSRRQVVLSFASPRSRNKFLQLAAQEGIAPRLRYAPGEHGVYALVSGFRKGAELVWDNSVILGEDILFPRAGKAPRRSTSVFRGMDSFADLEEGELLVHRDYGIGRFRGLQHLAVGGVGNDFLLLEYQGRDKLYVPVDRLDLIQRFSGGEDASPSLDRLGGTSWAAGKDRARKAIEQIAADLVEMYAYRKVAKGFSYGPVGDLYREFEATFGYEETPDQSKAIEDVLADMERPEPMDRLVCGDVGFGKTEVAMRAAFRAACEGRQVALLCPTTVLAEQHYQTFRSRMAGFPVNVGLLSRFVPADRQRSVLRAAAQGQVDILIGTHRLLSADVHLPNLGLLILDEEQRFGVRHKETLKSLKKNVDVLTLTATPIPRTLQLSMSGIRSLSIIETAPLERKPVATAILQREDSTLRSVLEREIAREGQVFWVYNRVQGLARVADYVRRLVPNARIGMAHGQMPEDEVETNMHKFWHGELDVLVCTSIVESGLDFPRANTLVVDQAQNFGLGQLYQLRGRVGRSDRQAYAFFVVPDRHHLSAQAGERLRIIQDMDYLGAGFKVAMEDLRLRGAGNILGEAQSGHISRVGLDLYLEMLEQAVERLKGTPASHRAETELNIGIPARIPETYMDDGRERLRYYKQLTGAESGQAREQVALAIRDRFGPFPEELKTFLAILDFKQFLGELQVERADLGLRAVKLSWAEGQAACDPLKIMTLAAQTHGAQMVPPATLVLPMPSCPSVVESLKGLRGELETVRAGGEGMTQAPHPGAAGAGAPAPEKSRSRRKRRNPGLK